jgi:hypothetical protein
MVNQQARALAHAPSHARRAYASAFAGKGDPQLLRATRTLQANKAPFEIATADEGFEFVAHKGGQARVALVIKSSRKGR